MGRCAALTRHATSFRVPPPPLLSAEQIYPAGEPGVRAEVIVLRSGLRVRTVQAGPPDGQPVVMLPGWGGSAVLYRKNIPALVAAGFRAIAVDLKGHGLSDKPSSPDEYTYEAMSAHVRDILFALDLPPVALVGQSMAGAIAAQVALDAPALVRRLVLLAPVGFGRVAGARFGRRVPLAVALGAARLIRRRLIRPLLRRLYGRPEQLGEEDMAQFSAQVGDPAYARSQHLIVQKFAWNACEDGRLRALRVPTLIVLGERDWVIDRRVADFYRRDVPHARIVTVPDTGHLVHHEAADLVNRELIAFLGDGRADEPRAAETGVEISNTTS
jgi:pimeloyl-ACP methyl ester carboxylesterase